jgi:broad specificity phosphatase PhoE
MTDLRPHLWLARHGETTWARELRHTSHTDLPLTQAGEAEAIRLGMTLRHHAFALVLTSPMLRATTTARLAGYDDVATVDEDLREWDYGELEGLRTAEIRARYPDWRIWDGPWPGGETRDQVAARVDRVIARCLAPEVDGDVLLIAHGHVLRVLAARWLGLPPASGAMFGLETATISIMGWEHDGRIVETWNAEVPPPGASEALGAPVPPRSPRSG